MKKQKRWYIVGEAIKVHKCRISGSDELLDLPMVWADGMVGAAPVFSNKRKARKYAGKDRAIIEVIPERKK